MSKNVLPVLVALMVVCIPLAGVAGAAGPENQLDLSLDRDAISTGEPLQISYTLYTEYSSLSMEVRRLADGAVMADIPGMGNGSGIYHHRWDSSVVPEGKYYLRLYGTTVAGIEEERLAYFILDNSPPETAVSSPDGLRGWYRTPVLLNATDQLSGVASLTYRIDDGILLQQSGYRASVAVPDGTHILSFQSADRTGNFEPMNTVRVKVDRTPPVIEYQLSGDTSSEGWFTSDVNITLRSGDVASGMDRAEYSLDGTHWIGYTGSFTIPFQSASALYYRAADLAGNTASGNIPIHFPPQSVSTGGDYKTGTPVPDAATTTPSPEVTAAATASPVPLTASASPSLSAVPDNSPAAPAATPVTPENASVWTMLGMVLVSIAVVIITASAVYIFIFKGKI